MTRATSAGVINNRTVRERRTVFTPRIIFTGVLAAFLAISVIFLHAAAANLQQLNNELEQQNSYLEAEIDSISNEITDGTTLDKIEKNAAKKYGMVYPNSSNYVKIKDESKASTNLADAIKDEVYG